jgi:hypothetical protein
LPLLSKLIAVSTLSQAILVHNLAPVIVDRPCTKRNYTSTKRQNIPTLIAVSTLSPAISCPQPGHCHRINIGHVQRDNIQLLSSLSPLCLKPFLAHNLASDSVIVPDARVKGENPRELSDTFSLGAFKTPTALLTLQRTK